MMMGHCLIMISSMKTNRADVMWDIRNKGCLMKRINTREKLYDSFIRFIFECLQWIMLTVAA